MADLELIIGNKNYSSWSLRAWLYLRQSGVAFRETRVPLYSDEWYARIPELSPTQQVPVLRDGDLTVWDSMAIIAYVRERYPGAVGWPEDPRDRAIARSISAEMHAGLAAIRTEMPLNCRATRRHVEGSDALKQQVERVRSIWRTCRAPYGPGRPWLFGDFSIADVAYAPVASRFATYGVQLDAAEQAYVDTVLALPAMREWIDATTEETEVLDRYEVGR